jgi:hypothetical protein
MVLMVVAEVEVEVASQEQLVAEAEMVVMGYASLLLGDFTQYQLK